MHSTNPFHLASRTHIGIQDDYSSTCGSGVLEPYYYARKFQRSRLAYWFSNHFRTAVVARVDGKYSAERYTGMHMRTTYGKPVFRLKLELMLAYTGSVFEFFKSNAAQFSETMGSCKKRKKEKHVQAVLNDQYETRSYQLQRHCIEHTKCPQESGGSER
ncbi:hypothetical protein PM082_015410 [Marasmius tenuissimus]|nr:hypothetical protein PM082_015410 [Marasmius tenuissimus]